MMIAGYARVSTKDQTLVVQVAQLRALGCDEIYTDQISGKTRNRVGLDACLNQLQEGDTLIVQAFDRLGRSLTDLLGISEQLKSKNVQLKSIREGIDTSTPIGVMYFAVTGAFAQFERDLISQRTLSGLAAARELGRVGGRPKALNAEQVSSIEEMIVGTSLSIRKIADHHGVSTSTVYKAFPGGRVALVKTRLKVVSDFSIGGDRYQILHDTKTEDFFWRLASETPNAHRGSLGPYKTEEAATQACRALFTR